MSWTLFLTLKNCKFYLLAKTEIGKSVITSLHLLRIPSTGLIPLYRFCHSFSSSLFLSRIHSRIQALKFVTKSVHFCCVSLCRAKQMNFTGSCDGNFPSKTWALTILVAARVQVMSAAAIYCFTLWFSVNITCHWLLAGLTYSCQCSMYWTHFNWSLFLILCHKFVQASITMSGYVHTVVSNRNTLEKDYLEIVNCTKTTDV